VGAFVQLGFKPSQLGDTRSTAGRPISSATCESNRVRRN